VPAGALCQSTAAPQRYRAVRVLAWKQEYRQVRIGPGDDGRTLALVRLTAGQQGSIVPATVAS
jgi:hypothetical protein